jgi:flagellar biosynthesis/type III secretory pathway protein FliH
MNLYINGDGNGGNTIWDAESAIAKEYQTKLDNGKSQAYAEGVSGQGFLGEKIDGMVAKPGILFKEMEANMENLPNLAISGATSIGELIAATVSKAITGVINKTVSGVEKSINKEVNKVTDKAVKEVNKKVNSYGPGALYKK